MIYLTVGIPASGKSTLAKLMCKSNSSCVRICRDDFRLMFNESQMMDGKGEKLVTKCVEDAIRSAASSGLSVVVDQTNCNLKFFKKLLNFCRSLDEVTVVHVDVSIDTAIERNSTRSAKVPEEVIRKMYSGYKDVTSNYNEGVYPKFTTEKYNPNVALPKAIIFDIDGTLALMGDRSPYDWKRVGVDIPNYPVVEALHTYWERGYQILIFSGRDSVCRSETMEWLESRSINYDILLMRPEKDMRPDTQVKLEMFNSICNQYNIVGVYDDRKSVKRMWTSIGLFVFDCNQTDADF